jgi:WD40 repeat protein
MTRLLFALLFCGLCVPVEAQEPDPEKESEPELGGSTEKATLALNPLGHVGPIRGTFFSPDGKQLVTVGKDRTVQFWDIASGERLQVMWLPFEPTATALAPDGKTLAIGRTGPRDERRVFLVNLNDGRVLGLASGENLGASGTVAALAFSRDGDQLAASNQGGGTPVNLLWRGLSGTWEKKPEQIASLKGRSFTPPSIREMFDITCLAFSPDGKRIAIGRLSSGVEGKQTAYLADVPVGDARPEKPLGLNLHTTVYGVAWTPDGKQVVTSDETYLRSRLAFWSADEGKLEREYRLGESRDGAGLHFLNAEKLVFTWSDDGSRKGPRGQGQSLLDLADLKEERKVFLPSGAKRLGCPGAVSSDGQAAAFVGGTHQNEVLIWEVSSGKQLHHLGKELATARSAGWSKDGRYLGFDSFEENKKPFFRTALDLQELQLLGKAERADYLFRYRVNGDWSVQKTPLEVRQGDRVVESNIAHATAWAISPGQEPRWFAYGEAYHGGALHLNDLRTGKKLTLLRPFNQVVLDLAPSPDGRWLLSVNDSQVAFLYRVADDPAKTDRMPLLYLFVWEGEWITWTREGYYAASPGGEKLMGWTIENGPDKLPTFHPAQRFKKHFYRPDLIKLVLEKGSVAEALEAAKVQQENLDQFLPPQGTLRLLEQNGALVKAQVSANARCKGQPVTELHLLVDGRPVRLGPDRFALKEFKPGQEKDATETWTVTLEPGTHKLSARVLARDTYSLSEEVTVEVKPPMMPPKNNKRGMLYYVGVGINHFQKHENLTLQGAVPDVKNLEECLKKVCAARFVEINSTVLTEKDATAAAILNTLKKLPEKLRPADVVIVHYSSHGEVDAKGGLYLLAHDTDRDDLEHTGVSGHELRTILSQYPCQVLLILDACHSGNFSMRPATDPLSRLLADDSCGVAVMTAALASQKALDTKEGGVFTQALIEGLSGKADPDKFSHRLFVHNLHGYVYGAVTSQTSNKQMPVYLPSGSVPPIVLKE